MNIKEIRKTTGLSQSKFADMFGIPVSTLRKWEQGEASPAPYIVDMLIKLLPSADDYLQEISDTDGRKYYYDKNKKTISDTLGNFIRIDANINSVKKENLPLYVYDMFQGLYEIQERFNRDCRLDIKEDIIWS